ncbi:MAG: ribosome hibernation-promoting factor, HPF/YfiA family [Moorellales bacterium]
MRLEIRTKNVELTEALRRYVEKRLARLARYLDGIEDIQVRLRLERSRHVVEVTIPLDGLVLRAEEQTGDMYASIDLVTEKLERQIAKYKTRLNRRLRTGAAREVTEAVPAEGSEETGPEATAEATIARVKRFPIKPMSIDEAILQMDLLGHNFFVFANSRTDRINVVYRRRDGRYGLIEPEE